MRLPSRRNGVRHICRRRVFLFATTALLASCLSPTLPLPPPAEPDSILPGSEKGVWSIRGNCSPGAIVLINNLNSGTITGTEDRDHNGRYFVQVPAEECDVAEVWELIDTTVSNSTYFVIQEVTAGLPNDDVCQP